jgi:hypothetical protein
MSRWEGDGRIIAHPVSAHDVASACTNIALSSGLLPPNTLFWKQQGDRPVIGIYVPARRWRMQTEGQIYHIPMSPLVFVGSGNAYQIYAVKQRPRDENARLYHAPCPNVHHHGGICQGNTPFPICSPRSIQTALTLFLEGSLFNADLSRGKSQTHPEDVRELWAELDGRKRFPLRELVPVSMSLGSIM